MSTDEAAASLSEFVAVTYCGGVVCEIWFSVALEQIDNLKRALERKYGAAHSPRPEEALCSPEDAHMAYRAIWFFLDDQGKPTGMLRAVRDCPDGKQQVGSIWYDDPAGMRMRLEERHERDN
jgi:hypothetical protein